MSSQHSPHQVLNNLHWTRLNQLPRQSQKIPTQLQHSKSICPELGILVPLRLEHPLSTAVMPLVDGQDHSTSLAAVCVPSQEFDGGLDCRDESRTAGRVGGCQAQSAEGVEAYVGLVYHQLSGWDSDGYSGESIVCTWTDGDGGFYWQWLDVARSADRWESELLPGPCLGPLIFWDGLQEGVEARDRHGAMLLWI
jgi:hypothetical protein